MTVVEYLPGTPPEWETGAAALQPTLEGGLAIVGPCPRCGDSIRKPLDPHLVPALGLPQTPTRIKVRVVCNCVSAHPNTPQGKHGCGAEGGIELEF
ncbi:MAG TPA: hypothetical protein VHA75_21355 [Rugosimonospora sp.]|nr:hypothetical protein [Rugosimonospora sp.]